MTTIIKSVEEAKENKPYLEALVEVVYQLADDDLITSYRGSEWLGLAPHIEADVAFSSITQNTMGHAAMFYSILEELGEGDADDLVHLRPASERRSSIYLEKVNGSGSYIKEPEYDWALAVVRNFFYETLKKVKLESALNSSYEPLRLIAQKALLEQAYHLAHWKLWIEQLQDSTEEAKGKISARVEEAWNEFGDGTMLGTKENEIVSFKILDDADTLKNRWLEEIKKTITADVTGSPKASLGNGRNCDHTEDLEQAITVFSEVFLIDQEAVW